MMKLIPNLVNVSISAHALLLNSSTMSQKLINWTVIPMRDIDTCLSRLTNMIDQLRSRLSCGGHNFENAPVPKQSLVNPR